MVTPSTSKYRFPFRILAPLFIALSQFFEIAPLCTVLLLRSHTPILARTKYNLHIFLSVRDLLLWLNTSNADGKLYKEKARDRPQDDIKWTCTCFGYAVEVLGLIYMFWFGFGCSFIPCGLRALTVVTASGRNSAKKGAPCLSWSKKEIEIERLECDVWNASCLIEILPHPPNCWLLILGSLVGEKLVRCCSFCWVDRFLLPVFFAFHFPGVNGGIVLTNYTRDLSEIFGMLQDNFGRG